jgi:hypothetical protein
MSAADMGLRVPGGDAAMIARTCPNDKKKEEFHFEYKSKFAFRAMNDKARQWAFSMCVLARHIIGAYEDCEE